MHVTLFASLMDLAMFHMVELARHSFVWKLIISMLSTLGFGMALVKPFFQFGIGAMFGRPTGGNLATPSVPVRFGTIQDVMVEFTGKNVPLRGQNQFPDDVAAGDKECKGKAAFGKVDINIFNSLFFGDTIETGRDVIVDAEEHVVAVAAPPVWAALTFYAIGDVVSDGTNVQKARTAGTSETPGPPTWNAVVGGLTPDGATIVWENVGPIASTVMVTNIGTWALDLGVIDLITGKAFEPVLVPPSAGEYEVTSGAYTFNVADIGTEVGISYVYTAVDGENLVVNNHILGYGPTFELWLSQPYQGANGLRLYKCRANKMSAPMKRDNYMIPDFEFEAYDDGQGRVFKWTQVSG